MNELIDVPRLTHTLQTIEAWIGRNVLELHVVVQLALMALAWGGAHLLTRVARPRLDAAMQRLPEAWRGSRVAVLVSAQLTTAIFLVLLWILVHVMRAVTWPSHSYMMGVVLILATAWLLIRIASALVRNHTIGNVVAACTWLAVALAITGLLEPLVAFMDAMALNVGKVRLSLLALFKGTLLMLLLVWVAVAVARIFESRIDQAKDIAPSARVLLRLSLRIVLISLAVLIGLDTVGIDLTALAVLSGAVGIGIGFGLQKIISNLISGVILLLDRSIKPGDVIQLDKTFGWITNLGARYVSLVTRDGREYLVPNEDIITHQVINWSYSDDLVRIETYIRAAYDADPHVVRRVAIEAAMTPQRVLRAPSPVCHIRSFGDSSLDFLLRFWITDPKNGVENITGEVLLAVWDAFKLNGIRVPFPQHEVGMRAAPGAAGEDPAPFPPGMPGVPPAG